MNNPQNSTFCDCCPPVSQEEADKLPRYSWFQKLIIRWRWRSACCYAPTDPIGAHSDACVKCGRRMTAIDIKEHLYYLDYEFGRLGIVRENEKRAIQKAKHEKYCGYKVRS